ncbi:MAG: 5-formyltetrahydrofolate cyclo-ligase [Chitinophagaceae bacterium]
MTKAALRAIYQEKRNAISSKEKLKLDDLLLLQFQSFQIDSIQSVLTFWPIEKFIEPNTHLFTSYLRHFVPNLHIAYPVCNFKTLDMQAIVIDEETVYNTNKYGIIEPKFGKAIAPDEIDIVFVPNIIIDKNGYRVGYGKGFYDRFLAKCHPNATFIGFNYFTPIDTITDTNNFDIPLNFCVTPTNVYEF